MHKVASHWSHHTVDTQEHYASSPLTHTGYIMCCLQGCTHVYSSVGAHSTTHHTPTSSIVQQWFRPLAAHTCSITVVRVHAAVAQGREHILCVKTQTTCTIGSCGATNLAQGCSPRLGAWTRLSNKSNARIRETHLWIQGRALAAAQVLAHLP
jgi:hypothetical protein